MSSHLAVRQILQTALQVSNFNQSRAIRLRDIFEGVHIERPLEPIERYWKQ